MDDRTFTAEQLRQAITYKDGRIVFSAYGNLLNSIRKGITALSQEKGLAREDLMADYRQHLKNDKFPESFIKGIFPYLRGAKTKKLNLPKHAPSQPATDPGYAAQVVASLTQRELERELTEIYRTIDAIDLDSDPFPVDLGEAAQWLGYSGEAKVQKQNAKATFLSMEPIETIDYLRMNVHAQVPSGAKTVENIRMTAAFFKKFCLRAGTKRAERVREYFIAAEARFRDGFKGQNVPQPKALSAENAAIVAQGRSTITPDHLSRLEEIMIRVYQRQAEEMMSSFYQALDNTKAELMSSFQKHQSLPVVDLKSKHGKLYQDVLEMAYSYPDGIHCPCCNKPTQDWEVDHWNSKTNPARNNGWKICRSCNQSLGAAGDSSKRHQYQARFDAFHIRCDDLEEFSAKAKTTEQLDLSIECP